MNKFLMFVAWPVTLGTTLMVALSVSSFLTMKSEMEKSSPFECGFSSLSSGSIPFSMPFFVISLVFILFDVEILLACLYPMTYSFSFWSSLYFWVILLMIFVATVYEWAKGVLKWI